MIQAQGFVRLIPDFLLLSCIPPMVSTQSLGCLLTHLFLDKFPNSYHLLNRRLLRTWLCFSEVFCLAFQHLICEAQKFSISRGENLDYLVYFFVASFSPKSWLLKYWLHWQTEHQLLSFQPYEPARNSAGFFGSQLKPSAHILSLLPCTKNQ